MKKKSQIQIFLSYAKEDIKLVEKLYNRLKQAGYHPWLDEKNLKPGQDERKEIGKAITNSDIVIACLSQKSVKGDIYRELRRALSESANRNPDSIYLIPLKLENCEVPDLSQEEYGVNLQSLKSLNYWEKESFPKLEAAINEQYNILDAEETPTNLSSIVSQRGLLVTVSVSFLLFLWIGATPVLNLVKS